MQQLFLPGSFLSILVVDGFKWDALPKWFLNDTLTRSSGIKALTMLCSTAMLVDIESLLDVAPVGMLTTLTIPSFDFDNPAGNVTHTGALARLQQP